MSNASKVQVTTWMKADIHERLKMRSVQQKKKLWELIEYGMIDYLARCEREDKIEAKNKERNKEIKK
ncbi:hypothetical protein QUB68_28215 [Microcoleus sp. A006_D1]|uniref:hypothetical protein n=1 Tax=Microcoleus sp. A006_D1 TaxID=3055267 RepID=UPI002FD1402B